MSTILPPARYIISSNSSTGIYSLTIVDFHVEDDGEYTCIATNAVGESSIIAVIDKNLQQRKC